jgi:hypothetical protein
MSMCICSIRGRIAACANRPVLQLAHVVRVVTAPTASGSLQSRSSYTLNTIYPHHLSSAPCAKSRILRAGDVVHGASFFRRIRFTWEDLAACIPSVQSVIWRRVKAVNCGGSGEKAASLPVRSFRALWRRVSLSPRPCLDSQIHL